jgi:hypothetical protein
MLSLLDLLTHLVGASPISEMAERVAGRSRLAVWQRVMDRLATLSPAEGRGYLRARGISVIRDETARLIDQEGKKIAAHRSQIEEAAMQLLIEMISAQLGQRAFARRRAA